jgi:hypothetical protein
VAARIYCCCTWAHKPLRTTQKAAKIHGTLTSQRILNHGQLSNTGSVVQ